jgi:hypothetical protein
VLAVWWEDGFSPARTDGFVNAMRDALRGYLRFANATRIQWPSARRTEKRHFGTGALTA